MHHFRNQLLPSTACIAPMGNASQSDEITSERRRGPRDPCDTFAEPRRGVNHRKRDPDRPAISPNPTGFVQELLESHRLVVPDVIYPSNPRLEDGGFSAGQCPRRRMRIDDTRLHRPRSPLRGVDPVPQPQRGVLVPEDQPIRDLGLVEQGGPKWHRVGTDKA